jgi:hypothetical protein
LKRQAICCGSVAQDSVILVSMVDNVGIVRTIWDVYGRIMFILFWGYIYPAVQVLGLWLAISDSISYLRNLGIEPTTIWM